MKLPKGWISQEFGAIVYPTASKPAVTKATRCVELEHVSQATGRILGWREGQVTEVSKSSFVKGDVLFGKLRPYLRKAWEATFDGICSSEFWVLSVNNKTHEASFIKQFVLSDLFSRATHASSGSKMPRAAWDMVSFFPFAFPPLPEQRKIAEILGTWDEALEKLDALIQAKERRKKALMQQLLTGKVRVKGFTEPWKTAQLCDLAENVADQNRGRMGTQSLYGVTKAAGVVPMREHVKGESFARCKRVETDWFAYNPMRINIGSIARYQGSVPVMVSGDYVVFRCNEERLLPAYLDHLRKSWMWESFVTRGGNGSVRIRIYFSDLGEFRFRRPPVEEQRVIAEILDTCDEELRLLRAERDALDQQKRGLMQRLLTGKVRVKL